LIKNKINEVEFIYDRIVHTAKSITEQKKDNKHNWNEYANDFMEYLPKEISKISNIINNTVPLEKLKLDSEIEIYFNDISLTQSYDEYSIELKNINDFFVIELPKQTDALIKKIQEIEGFSFNKLKESEKKLIKNLTKAHSISWKDK
jgi:hypothetical protein